MDRRWKPGLVHDVDDLDDLDDEQRNRFAIEAERISALYGDAAGSAEDRAAVLSTLLRYIRGEISVDAAGRQRRETAEAARSALVSAQLVARLAVQDGMSEAEAARRTGVDRMTVRKALGKAGTRAIDGKRG